MTATIVVTLLLAGIDLSLHLQLSGLQHTDMVLQRSPFFFLFFNSDHGKNNVIVTSK